MFHGVPGPSGIGFALLNAQNGDMRSSLEQFWFVERILGPKGPSQAQAGPEVLNQKNTGSVCLLPFTRYLSNLFQKQTPRGIPGFENI